MIVHKSKSIQFEFILDLSRTKVISTVASDPKFTRGANLGSWPGGAAPVDPRTPPAAASVRSAERTKQVPKELNS